MCATCVGTRHLSDTFPFPCGCYRRFTGRRVPVPGGYYVTSVALPYLDREWWMDETETVLCPQHERQ